VNKEEQRKLTMQRARLQKRRMRKRRRRAIRRFYRLAAVFAAAAVIFLIVIFLPKIFGGKEGKYPIKPPQLRTESEVMEELSKLAAQYKEFQEVEEHPEKYTEELLAALVNNPEMIDFVKGYPSKNKSSEGLTNKEKKEEFPLFLQWDSRWGYDSYGSGNIGLSGCGPTCLAMAAYALTRDEGITPAKVAQFAESNDYYVEGTGTAWSLMTEGAGEFGIVGTELSRDEDTIKEELDKGHPIICTMAPGDFTAAGHFIMIYDYDKKGFFINDPNCISRSKKRWKYEDIKGQIKNLWTFQKKTA